MADAAADPIEHLIGLLARLPGLGRRSARRAVLKMLMRPDQQMLPLAEALQKAAEAVRPCTSAAIWTRAILAASAATPRASGNWFAWWRGWRTSGRWSARTPIAAFTTCWAAP